MRILGIIIWVVGLMWAVAQGFNIRNKTRNEQATEHTFELHALLLAVSVIVIPVFSLSPFHLLWMVPTSFVLGLTSVIPPLNLLWFPASLYGSLWYVGVRDPGRAYYLAGDYAKAIDEFNKTIQSKPDSVWAHFNLGCAYGKLGNKQKALDSYKEVVRLTPTSSQAHYNLGMTHKDMGNFAEATESFKEAIRIQPDYDAARWNLGMTCVEVGDIENALKEYEVLQKSDQKHAAELHSAISAKNGQEIVPSDG